MHDRERQRERQNTNTSHNDTPQRTPAQRTTSNQAANETKKIETTSEIRKKKVQKTKERTRFSCKKHLQSSSWICCTGGSALRVRTLLRRVRGATDQSRVILFLGPAKVPSMSSTFLECWLIDTNNRYKQ